MRGEEDKCRASDGAGGYSQGIPAGLDTGRGWWWWWGGKEKVTAGGCATKPCPAFSPVPAFHPLGKVGEVSVWLCLKGERGRGWFFPRVLGGSVEPGHDARCPREVSAGWLGPCRQQLLLISAIITRFGKSFDDGAVVFWESRRSRGNRVPRSWRQGAGSPASASFIPFPPRRPPSLRDALPAPALAKFRYFYSSLIRLPRLRDKQTRLCLFAPLPLSPAKKERHFRKCCVSSRLLRVFLLVVGNLF